jgi:hypothetical protein
MGATVHQHAVFVEGEFFPIVHRSGENGSVSGVRLSDQVAVVLPLAAVVFFHKVGLDLLQIVVVQPGFFVVFDRDRFDQELVLELGKINVGKWITENEFIQSVYKLLDSWFSSNRALGVVWMLPVSALAMKIAFRKGARKLNLNLVEYFLVRTYAACQIFIVSILLLPLSKDPEDSLPWWLYFIFSFWINLQLFNDKIKTTFFRTVLMYVYLILILILLALFLASILVFILWIFN